MRNTKRCFFISFGLMADQSMVDEFEMIRKNMPGIVVTEGRKKKGYYVSPDPAVNTGFDSPYQMLVRKYGCYSKGTTGLTFHVYNPQGVRDEVDDTEFVPVMV